MPEQDACDELCSYTLSRGDAEFIHQLAVHAFTAQHASEHTKAIGTTFALIGLYLAVEKQSSRGQVIEPLKQHGTIPE